VAWPKNKKRKKLQASSSKQQAGLTLQLGYCRIQLWKI